MSIESSPIAGGQEPVSNMSVEEYIAQRVANSSNQEEPAEESEDTQEVVEQPDEQEQDDIIEDAEDDDSGESEAELDLLSLTTEQIQLLAKNGKSRLLQRVGELTAQKKALEERLQSQETSKPIREVPDSDNPFRGLSDVNEIQSKRKELEQVLEDTDTILEDHEDYAPSDIITVGDREFTKAEIRKANRNARDGITKYLPAQEQKIHKIGKLSQMAEHYGAAARKEIPDISDSKSEVGSRFNAMMNDPIVQQVKDKIPELGAQMEYLLAHAASSIFGKSKSLANASNLGSKLKVNPSSSPSNSSANRNGSVKPRKAAEAYNKFEQSQSVDDWISARIAQYK